MIRRITRVAVVGLLLVVACSPSVAHATEPQLVERRVETVTGADLAIDALQGLRGIELDSDGATITLDADGTRRDVPLRLSTLSGAPAGAGEPYAGIALLAFLGSVVARIAAVLSRLLG